MTGYLPLDCYFSCPICGCVLGRSHLFHIDFILWQRERTCDQYSYKAENAPSGKSHLWRSELKVKSYVSVFHEWKKIWNTATLVQPPWNNHLGATTLVQPPWYSRLCTAAFVQLPWYPKFQIWYEFTTTYIMKLKRLKLAIDNINNYNSLINWLE